MYKYFKTFKNPEIWDNYAFKSICYISWNREKVVKNLELIMVYFEQDIVAHLTSNFLCSIMQAKMEIKIIRENRLDIECSFILSEWYWMFLVFKSIFDAIFTYIEFKKKHNTEMLKTEFTLLVMEKLWEKLTVIVSLFVN